MDLHGKIFNPELLLISFLAVIYYPVTSGQEISKSVATEICQCVDTIENMDSLEAKIDRCAYDALEDVVENLSDEIQESFSNAEVVDRTLTDAMGMLLGECPKIRMFIIYNRQHQFYRLSESEAANDYYEKGNKLFLDKDYKGAAKLFSKALRKDHGFIFALDNLALSLRQTGDYKRAVKYYQKSLQLYPEGKMALQNLGATYSFLNENDNALDCYQKLIYFYPDDPDGYLGLGKVLVRSGEYEMAIDYVFIAHKINTYRNSENVKESETLAMEIYNKLKEQDKLELFIQKAKEYGITIN
jgi:tetratricopeptide (TPR) repeat protein